MKKIKKIFSKIASWGCTLLLIFSALAALASVFLRNPNKVTFIGKYAVVRILTESMEPTIQAGDYILIEKVKLAELEEGDVITFYSDDPTIAGLLNTHRVYAFTEAGAVVTKGDNNLSADEYEVTGEKVVGRYAATLSFLTGIFNIFSKPIGYVALILLPLLLIMSVSFKDVVEAAKNGKDEKEDEVAAELARMKESGELEKRLAELAGRKEEGEDSASPSDDGKKKSE